MVIRTYFSKNNTIVNGSNLNTSQNPVTELFYGGELDRLFSRFIFEIDLSRIRGLYDNGFYNPNLITHTLRMTNTGAFDNELQGGLFQGKDRSSSFNLILFPIDDEWDEGVGYDYTDATFLGPSNPISLDTSPSNWYDAKTNIEWSQGEGIYSGSVPTLKTIHFDHGNENINLDITDIINDHLTGTTANTISLGLAYTEDLELNTVTDTGRLQYVGFFTRHTQTFYEPYLESSPNDYIKDDRALFYLDKDNRLYLYTNLGVTPTNLDNLPTVSIYDDQGILVSAITATHQSLGVYYVEVNIPSDGQNDCTLYTDVWSNISINGNSRPDIELEFAVKNDGYFNLGSDVMDAKDYGLTITGVKLNENIVRGDIRKVLINAKIPYTVNQKANIDNLEYRIYVKEGKSQYTVIDYNPVNISFNQNYFLLDTESLVPNTYYLDIRYNSNYETKILSEALKFNIVSQSELRNSQ